MNKFPRARTRQVYGLLAKKRSIFRGLPDLAHQRTAAVYAIVGATVSLKYEGEKGWGPGKEKKHRRGETSRCVLSIPSRITVYAGGSTV